MNKNKLPSLKTRKELISICCNRWKKQNPKPRCELFYLTSYQLLVSVVLSAQTTDKMVNRAMEPIYKKGFTPQDAIKLKVDGLYELIKSIGLANTKAKNIFKLSQVVLNDFSNEIPKTRDDLESLPGVGRKTANVILGEIFGEPTLAVDTHVLRVSKRLGLHNEKDPNKTEKILLKLIDPRYLPTAHHWLILHGRYTCKARKPDCEHCILNDICPQII